MCPRILRAVFLFIVISSVTCKHEKTFAKRQLDFGDSKLSSHMDSAVMKIELKGEDAKSIKSSDVEEITITRKVPVPVPVPVEKRVPVAVPVPVDQPFPVYIPKPVPFAVHKPVPYTVKVPVVQPFIAADHNTGQHSFPGHPSPGQNNFPGHHFVPGHFPAPKLPQSQPYLPRPHPKLPHPNIAQPRPMLPHPNVPHPPQNKLPFLPTSPPSLFSQTPLGMLKKLILAFKMKLNPQAYLPKYPPPKPPPPKQVIKHVPVPYPVEKVLPVPVEVKVPMPYKVKEYIPINFHSTTEAIKNEHLNSNEVPNHHIFDDFQESAINYYIPSEISTEHYHKSNFENNFTKSELKDISDGHSFYTYNYPSQLSHEISHSIPKFVPMPEIPNQKFIPLPDTSDKYLTFSDSEEVTYDTTTHHEFIKIPSENKPYSVSGSSGSYLQVSNDNKAYSVPDSAGTYIQVSNDNKGYSVPGSPGTYIQVSNDNKGYSVPGSPGTYIQVSNDNKPYSVPDSSGNYIHISNDNNAYSAPGRLKNNNYIPGDNKAYSAPDNSGNYMHISSDIKAHSVPDSSAKYIHRPNDNNAYSVPDSSAKYIHRPNNNNAYSVPDSSGEYIHIPSDNKAYSVSDNSEKYIHIPNSNKSYSFGDNPNTYFKISNNEKDYSVSEDSEEFIPKNNPYTNKIVSQSHLGTQKYSYNDENANSHNAPAVKSSDSVKPEAVRKFPALSDTHIQKITPHSGLFTHKKFVPLPNIPEVKELSDSSKNLPYYYYTPVQYMNTKPSNQEAQKVSHTSEIYPETTSYYYLYNDQVDSQKQPNPSSQNEQPNPNTMQQSEPENILKYESPYYKIYQDEKSSTSSYHDMKTKPSYVVTEPPPVYEIQYVPLSQLSYYKNLSHAFDTHQVPTVRIPTVKTPQAYHHQVEPQSGFIPSIPPMQRVKPPGYKANQYHYHVKVPFSAQAHTNKYPTQQYHYNYYVPVTEDKLVEKSTIHYGSRKSEYSTNRPKSNEVHYHVFAPVTNQIETYSDFKPIKNPHNNYNKSEDIFDNVYQSLPSQAQMANREYEPKSSKDTRDSDYAMSSHFVSNHSFVEGPVRESENIAAQMSIDPFQYIRYAPAVRPVTEHSFTLTPTKPTVTSTTEKTYNSIEEYVSTLSFTKNFPPGYKVQPTNSSFTNGHK